MTATIHCAGCQHAYIATALFCPNCGRPRVREAPADPLLGKLLGERFLVQDLIGQGGSGTIYRAEHVTLRRKVAIKVLHTELSRDDLAVERFRREATTVAEIDNEHIVEIHDFGRTPDGRLYLAMELLEGETLDTVLARDQQLSVERTADILSQVGEALMEAHAIGYVHRDLRPRNIYLAVRRGKANFVKLLDFGLAKLVEAEGQAASTSLGMTFGDPRYMSPEQARGDRIDRRADIYQLGCVAYEMLTGAPPFGGNRVFDILTRQVTEIPQPLPTRRPGVPLWMEAAVTKMLAKDPENRFATTTRMVEALRRGLETGEVMEDEIARRRESIPPPSVSRVMQRLGVQSFAEPPRPEPPSAPPASAAPASAAPASPPVAAPAPPARTAVPPMEPTGAYAARPAGAAGVPPLAAMEPGVTLRAPIAPPPAKPDSVELLRKRTGTPRIGVPLVDPAVVLPAQARVALPGRPAVSPDRPAASPDRPVTSSERPFAAPPAQPVTSPERPFAAPPAQASVSGVIDPSPAAGRGAAPSAPLSRREPSAVLPPSSPDDAQPRGKPQKPAASELNISQVWYDEGDQLSGGGDPSRTGRVRRPLAISTVDLVYDDEPRPRRWGLIAGIGTFVVFGGIMAYALTRGGSSGQPAAVAQTAPPAAAPAPAPAPAPIATPEPPPPPSQIVGSGDATGAAPRPAPTHRAKTADVMRPSSSPPAASPPPRPAPPARRVADAHSAEPRAETRAPAHRASEPSYPILGSEPTRRPPSFTSPGSVAPPAPTPARAAAPSLTDSPKDPYGEDAPGDSAPPERKAEFFANLGGQQLIGGDTAGAAGSFQKALELDAKNVPAMMGMGEIALRQGLFGDAIAHLSKASKLVPKNVKVLTLLGEAYLSSGNNAQAAAQFKKALQLDPDNARARDGYNEASSRVPPPGDDN
ncbi:MAG TPA: protein kinase [Kofleriaceae bacterium]|jgi:serine/threonine-protein kinase|nr:protein kinase [Kofleriaceae bacterium]